MLAALYQLAQTSSGYNYSYSYSTPTATNTAVSAGLGLAFLATMLIVGLLVYLFFGFCYYKIFKKAGRTDAWAGFVPIYNMWVLFEVAGRPGWWALLALIPIFGGIVLFILSIIALIDLAKSFGKSAGYAALLILLPIIGFPMLAFGDAAYQGPAGPERAKPKTPPPAVPPAPTAPTPPPAA